MNEEISDGTAITLAAAVTVGILALPALLLAAHDDETHKSGRNIKTETCPVQVITFCGGYICQYTARVPCAELEDLSRKERKNDTE